MLHEIAYYSAARSGTGIRFQAAVEYAVALVLRHPLGGAPASASTRSVPVRGFPFRVVYRVTATEVLVVAIAAHKRRSGYWEPRVPDG